MRNTNWGKGKIIQMKNKNPWACKEHTIMNKRFESKRMEKIPMQKLKQGIVILDRINFKREAFYEKLVIS